MKNSKTKTYRCRNRTTCEFGKLRKEIIIGDGHRFACPLAIVDCERKNLTEVVRSSGNGPKKILTAVLVVLLAVGLIWYLSQILFSRNAPEITAEEALRDVWPWLK